jgi:hypothetical protein
MAKKSERDGEGKSNDSPTERHFNLLYAPWIPVLWRDGRAERVGIKAALTKAGKIRQIAATNPMDNVALLRFLLAVLLWCKPDAKEALGALLDADPEAPGIPEDDWLGKLDRHQPAFELLRPGVRFLQASAQAANPRPIADLFHEVPGRGSAWHFCHFRDNSEKGRGTGDGVCPACAAIGLVRLAPTLTGKGRGKFPGINGDPPVYFEQVNDSLLRTLQTNCPTQLPDGDRPAWDGPGASNPNSVGPMEGYTWMSRQFRLGYTQEDAERICAICGTSTKQFVWQLLEENTPNGRAGLSRCSPDNWRDPQVVYYKDAKDNPRSLREDALVEAAPSASEGRWRKWSFAAMDQAQVGASNASTQWSPAAHAIFMAVDSAKVLEARCVSLRADASRRELLERIGRAWEELAPLPPVDSAAQLKFITEKLRQLKNRHFLRVVRPAKREGEKLKHPPLPESTRAAIALLAPEAERKVRAALSNPAKVRQTDAAADSPEDKANADTEFLRNIYKPVVEQVVDATAMGSPLRRRAAKQHALALLNKNIKEIVDEVGKPVGESEAKPTKPKRGRKKKEGA